MTLTTMTSFPPCLVRDLILIPLVREPNPSLHSNNTIERSQGVLLRLDYFARSCHVILANVS
jgi:hypothetical protein